MTFLFYLYCPCLDLFRLNKKAIYRGKTTFISNKKI